MILTKDLFYWKVKFKAF